MAPTLSQSPTARGQQRWFFGMLAEVKASAADTGGRYSLLEITAPAGHQVPLHVHYREDEGFYVLDGTVTIEVGDETVELGPGQHAFGPRNIPHRFTVGPRGCRMLFIMVPGGMEDMIRATSVPAASRTLPPPPDEEPDLDAIKAIVKQYGYELLG